MELLNCFGIAPRQLLPNSWRIVISCMEIWLAATEGDMIRVDELVYLYRLKESKEHGYYELVPWERRTRIVRDLPSSFRYRKSCFFFVSEDEWEIPSGKVWGDLPRLLRRWGTPHLGASLFFSTLCFSVWFCLFLYCYFFGFLVQLRDDLSSRVGINNAFRLLLNTQSLLTISTIWSILILWLCIALARSPPLTSCVPLKGKRRRVSI